MNKRQRLESFLCFTRLTSGSCYVYALGGVWQRFNRQKIIAVLTGRKKPQKECGVNAIRDFFVEFFDLQDLTRTEEDQVIQEKVKLYIHKHGGYTK